MMFDWLFPLMLEPLKSFIAGAAWMLAIILIGFLFWWLWTSEKAPYEQAKPEDRERLRKKLMLEEFGV